jgi:hypothetical protein
MAGGRSLSPKSRTMMVSVVCASKWLILEPKQRIKKLVRDVRLLNSDTRGIGSVRALGHFAGLENAF